MTSLWRPAYMAPMTTKTTKTSKTRARTLARTVGTAAAQRAVRMTGTCPKCGCTFVADHSDTMSGPAKRTRAQWRTAFAATRTPATRRQHRTLLCFPGDKPPHAFDAAEQAQWDALKYGGTFHEWSIPPGVYVAGSRMGPDEYGAAKPRKRRSK